MMDKKSQIVAVARKTIRHMDAMHSGEQVGGILLAGDPGVGKAQPLTAKIKIPNGWTTMGEIAVGDVVSTPDGGTANVTGVYPQGERQVYKITFSDGRVTHACGEHLWKTRLLRTKKWNVISTNDIRKYLDQTKRWVYVPTVKPVDDSTSNLPLEPYTLGALLGDGCFRNSSIVLSSSDKHIIDRVNLSISEYAKLVYVDQYDYRLVHHDQTKFARQHYTGLIQDLGLWDTTSATKFIPQAYKTASVRDRQELLAGLIDTDGYVSKAGVIVFTTVSSQLSNDVVDIVRSLGGHASVAIRYPFYKKNGEKIPGQQSYNITIRYSQPSAICSLPRKLERLPKQYQYSNLDLRITNIEPAGIEPVQCIMVDHPDHLYITDDFIVTHNTTFVETLGQALGLPVITIEVPHITEEHIINIPFIVFNPLTGTTQQMTASAPVDEYELVLAKSNLYQQLVNAHPIADAQYQQMMASKNGPAQMLFKALGGADGKIPSSIASIRSSHHVILFLDEFYRNTSLRIRNILRGILNGNIGMHKLPKSVYVVYASNMRDSGIDEIPSNHQFNVVEYEAPKAGDWFEYIVSKYEQDAHLKMKPEVVAAFKEVIKDEHMSYEDMAAEVRTSPRRWEQLLSYINTSLPVQDAQEARALITNVKNNFIHYQTEKHSDLATKVVEAVTKLIERTSNITVNASDTLGHHEWRTALDHAVKQLIDSGGKRKHIPVLSGPPGIGKTSVAAMVAAKHNLRLIDIDVSEIYADDAIGMPIPGQREGKDINVKFSMPKLYQQINKLIQVKDEQYIAHLQSQGDSKAVDQYKAQPFKYLIFLDELNRVDEKTFNALRKIILEKNFGIAGDGKGTVLTLPKEAIMVAAINPEGVGTSELTHHFRDVIDVIPAKASWRDTREWIMARTYKNVPDQTKRAVMNIIEEFVGKFQTTDQDVGVQQRAFHLDVGTDLYISPREYSDMFSTIGRELNHEITELQADPEIDSEDMRDPIDEAVSGALIDSLRMIFYKHQVDGAEFFEQTKAWVSNLPDSVFNGIVTKHADLKRGMSHSLTDYLEGKDITSMPDDMEVVNANNTMNNHQFIDQLKAALLGSITDDKSVHSHIIDQTEPKVELDGEQLKAGTVKVSKIVNFMHALLYTLHIHGYQHDRLNSVGRSLSSAMSELRKSLIASGQLSDEAIDKMTEVVTDLRIDILDTIAKLP